MYHDFLTDLFASYKQNTRRLYVMWCERFARHIHDTTGTWTHPRNAEQWHVTAFQAHLVRPAGYSRATCNQAAIALRHLFAALGRDDLQVVTVSARTELRHIDTITPEQAAAVITALPPLYRAIAGTVYNDCEPPGVVCHRYYSRGGTVAVATLTGHLRRAGVQVGIGRRVTAKLLHQSGIVHAIGLRGVDTEWIMRQARINRRTLRRYIDAL